MTEAAHEIGLADPEALGAVAVALAWYWTAWVNRRVETIEFVEDTPISPNDERGLHAAADR
jgi:hypothetical protein